MNSQELHAFCASLPGAHVDIKWDDHVCHCVAEKMFAIQTEESNGVVRLSIKADPDLFEVLVQQAHFKPAPYLARYKWVAVEDVTKVDDARLKSLVEDSYRLIFQKLPARTKKQIESESSGK